MDPVAIPFAFVRDRLALTWPDVAWGFRSGWLDAAAVVDYAVDLLLKDEKTSPVVVALAGLTRSELWEVPALLERIVGDAGTEDSAASRPRWLFLVLAWVYEHRADWDDPLGVVEDLFVDFDYPEEIRGFVRSTPVEDGYEPAAHSRAENVARLMSTWEHYLGSFERQ